MNKPLPVQPSFRKREWLTKKPEAGASAEYDPFGGDDGSLEYGGPDLSDDHLDYLEAEAQKAFAEMDAKESLRGKVVAIPDYKSTKCTKN